MPGSEGCGGGQKYAPPEIIILLVHKLRPKKYGLPRNIIIAPTAAVALYSSRSHWRVKTTLHATPRHTTPRVTHEIIAAVLEGSRRTYYSNTGEEK